MRHEMDNADHYGNFRRYADEKPVSYDQQTAGEKVVQAAGSQLCYENTGSEGKNDVQNV